MSRLDGRAEWRVAGGRGSDRVLSRCMLAPRRPRYDTLDAWRGLACLLVVVFHAANNTAGWDGTGAGAFDAACRQALTFASKLWVGVPLFFVISGYCVAAAADSGRRRSRAGRTFFARRFRRIYPPVWVFLALCVTSHVILMWVQSGTGLPLAISHRDPADVPAVSWVGSMTLTEEWRWNLFGPGRNYFQCHLWTLCYEEQFYLVTGLAVVFAPRRVFAVLAGVSAGVFLIVVDVIRLPFAHAGFFFDGAWLEFAAGVAVYWRRNYASRFSTRLIDVGLILATFWAARGVRDWGAFAQTVPAHLTVAFAAAFLLGVLQEFDGATGRWWLLAPLRWSGLRCYSLYLVHSPVVYLTCRVLQHAGWTSPAAILFGIVPVCLVLSLAAGWLFFRCVEVHFLNPPAATPSPPLTQTPMPLETGRVSLGADSPTALV